MNLNFYRFDLAWEIDRARDLVFDALTELEDYPRWWPDYREVRQLDESTVAIVLQSSLPYKLRITNRFLANDRARGHFRLAIDGDIAGWIDFALTDQGNGFTKVRITQECTAEKRLLRVLAPIGRRAFAYNHGLTMRRGRLGLSGLLSGEHH
ncbi:SRPBCC family protein [Lentzea sp. DG1S-22]|uniref:SRPBCC family protein n=1 Tax=Lentzea sp. DG1S-22 TaxID=3108822 RepID=UPI002E75D8CC|nr:SRPBCC family protein [Lentzea sp. DG1S-22]WVH82426.1 SRPBCC family protein [Lentzea sp. DG1S-22]